MISEWIKDQTEWIKEETGVANIQVDVKKEKWAWVGYVCRTVSYPQSLGATEYVPRHKKCSKDVRGFGEVRKLFEICSYEVELSRAVLGELEITGRGFYAACSGHQQVSCNNDVFLRLYRH